MSNDTEEYLICLTAPGSHHPRLKLSIPPTERLSTLYQRASQEFPVPPETSHRSSLSSSLLLFCGIPPRQLPLPFDTNVESEGQSQEFDSILVRSLVARNDLVTVRWISTTTIATNDSTASTTKTTKRTQRAAAKVATESFPAVIQAQEEQTKQCRQSTKAKPIAKAKTKPKSKPTSTVSIKAFTSLPPGRRLIDGDTIIKKKSNIHTKIRHNNQSSAPSFRQESDISTALLTALQSGNSGGKVGQVLRTVMTSALSSSYQATRAVVRIAAVQANQYTIVLQPNNTTLQITFSKMTQGRGDYEDVVDWIPIDALTQVMTAIHASDPESFRPMTLAQVSPRVFWSLLYHTHCPTTIEEAYSTLLPELDWTFLKRRKYTLSEKAMENLRQEQEQHHQEDNLQAACDVVQAVENAMETLQAHDRHRQRDQMAQAALARFSNSNTYSNTSQEKPLPEQQCSLWCLVTPTEIDEDELLACLATDNKQQQQHVASLIQMNIVNWRLLANCQSTYLSEALHLPEATIDKWLEHAQQESLQEIMVEICDLNIHAVEALAEEAKSGTPKDLANWRRIPDMLWATIPSIQNDISITTLETWCQRAYHVLQEYSWLSWYATPVD